MNHLGYEVRPATLDDVVAIDQLLQTQIDKGKLLPRTLPELYERVRDFFVAESGGEIVGCGALQLFTAELGEIRSLAVSNRHEGQGYGRALVERLIEESRRIGLRKLMALTYVPLFFHRLGFETVDRDTLPEKVWGVCVYCPNYHNCNEIAVLKWL
ncbi:MAG: N-acetyltransferase [Proteobacteria bacterium]|nr:MAG: N-acetyltransferase [Pseudomonadota bacterium]